MHTLYNMQIYIQNNVLTGAKTSSFFYETCVNDQTVVQPRTCVRMPGEPCPVTVSTTAGVAGGGTTGVRSGRSNPRNNSFIQENPFKPLLTPIDLPITDIQ